MKRLIVIAAIASAPLFAAVPAQADPDTPPSSSPSSTPSDGIVIYDDAICYEKGTQRICVRH